MGKKRKDIGENAERRKRKEKRENKSKERVAR